MCRDGPRVARKAPVTARRGGLITQPDGQTFPSPDLRHTNISLVAFAGFVLDDDSLLLSTIWRCGFFRQDDRPTMVVRTTAARL